MDDNWSYHLAVLATKYLCSLRAFSEGHSDIKVLLFHEPPVLTLETDIRLGKAEIKIPDKDREDFRDLHQTDIFANACP